MKKPTVSALLSHARSRTTDVQARVRRAMSAMAQDILESEGIYPFNSGRLTQSEVCRRAGIHKVTLQGKTHKDTTRSEIDRWLTETRAKLINGKKDVRRTVTERAENWKALYLGLAREFNLYKIESIAKDSRITALETEVATIRRARSSNKAHGRK